MKNRLQNFVNSSLELSKEILDVRSYMKTNASLFEIEELDKQYIFNNSPEGGENDGSTSD